ncbi:hypothetical protein ACJIZ3_021919 [Penstemon smallii]|uniref:Glycosyltransferase n=1 Tax=Penstemon smallii TaxID=265156 RepID=A0ABD3SMT4_9LAMI
MAETKLHAIMIAFSFQGHITPFINLALKLASNGFKITFVHTEFTHQMLSKAHQDGVDDEEEATNFFSKARKSGLDITYKTISDGFSLEYDRILNFNEYWESMLHDFPSRVDELIGDIIKSSDSSLVPFLVADTFYSWPSTIANKYNILNISFWTQPALVFSIAYHLDLLKQYGNFPSKGNDQEEQIDYIPGVGPISSKDLMSYLQDKDTTTIVHQIVYKAFDQVKFADFVLINTVNELENGTLLALNENQPTFAIGPINFSTDFTKVIVPKSLWVESDCTEWLNAKPTGSVLYVSFGSLAQSNKELTEEIAHGLLISEVNFIWVLKTDTDVLPDGFKNDIKDRGMIVSWCNQNAVLSNSGIGGFLTHCGWNSILESIWCGVPMICYPFFADQPTNRKLVVDDWKIGINLCDGARVNRDEVAEKIKRIMCIETSKSLRNEIKKLGNVVRSSLDDVGGSTRTNFDQFIKDLKAKIYAK